MFVVKVQKSRYHEYMRYPNFSQERELRSLGYKNIAGVDEAGRGSWAGPVVAAAVVLDTEEKIIGLKDSKLLSLEKREELYEMITTKVAWGVGMVEPAQIDKLNILVATRIAMKQALEKLPQSPDFALLDAVRIGDLACRQRSVIKGDLKIMSIAAASIIAKVTRDRLLVQLHNQHPEYRFDIHKGYGTKLHREKLAKFGPSPIHRFSYKPFQQKQNQELQI